MKKTLLLMIAALAFCAAFMTSCSDDNNEPDVVAPQTYEGNMSSVIPMFPDFDAAVSTDKAVVTWADATMAVCTIDIGGFNVHIDRPELPQPMDIAIGDMKVTGVKCTKEADGSYALLSESFDCMAGRYEITGGKLTGSIKSGKLVITLNYKPGTMPFPVVSTFSGDIKK